VTKALIQNRAGTYHSLLGSKKQNMPNKSLVWITFTIDNNTNPKPPNNTTYEAGGRLTRIMSNSAAHVLMKCSRDGTATSPGFLLITLKLFG